MSFSLSPSKSYTTILNLSSSRSISQSRSNGVKIPICFGSKKHRFPLLVAQAEHNPESITSVPLDPEQEMMVADNKDQNKGPGWPNFSIPNIPPWASVILGSVLLLVVPFYKKILNIEDQIEKTATSVLDVVEKVAEVTDELAEDIGKSLPENSKLKKLAQTVEKLAEEVDRDAEAIESLVKKIDDAVDEVDRMVEPIIEGKIKLDGSKSTKNNGPTNI